MKPNTSVLICFTALTALAQGPGGPNGSLKRVPVPQPTNLNQYVRDVKMLVVLGKAFFWDMQVSSDGRVACATCHFHAGADHRAANQLANPTGDFRANHVFASEDFPFHKLANINDNRSSVVSDTSERAGSAGLFRRLFTSIVPMAAAEQGVDLADAPAFSAAGLNVRRVTRRNSPSVINAVFNVRNYWDGRASNIFTGFTPFGDSDTTGAVLVSSNGTLRSERVRMDNSSLASQAMGPVLDDTEMSYSGRTWPTLGKKMLPLRALAMQRVAADDSVLGAYAAERGLQPQYTYLALIQAAFQPAYWESTQTTDDFTQAEYNFPLFWGIALQAYQSTLISDDTRFDRFSDGDTTALSALEQAGLREFRGGGTDCSTCHAGPEFTMASFGAQALRGPITRQRNGTGQDTGYFRNGVRPVADDGGLAAEDSFGNPLSLAVRQANSALSNIAGAFKVPGLRNSEFTGPYFHNGGQATLQQVIDFYARGGDFPNNAGAPTDIRPRNLSPAERASLVAFLKSLSDDRVRFERAPFDHPELCVSAGAGATPADVLFPLSAPDNWVGIPAVGKGGNDVPLQTFEELLAGIGSDGTRAHAMADTCTIP